MKKLTFLSIFFLLIAVQTVSAEVFVYFQPGSSTIDVGDLLTVNVMISGVVQPWLGGYDIDISYDPAILPLSAVNWADNFLGLSLQGAVFSPGSVEVTEVSLDSAATLGALQSGNDPFRLFLLLFAPALAPGTSPLTFDQVILTDGDGNPLNLGAALNGSVKVGEAPIPEPTTMLLLGSGLIGLAGYGRKKFFKK